MAESAILLPGVDSSKTGYFLINGWAGNDEEKDLSDESREHERRKVNWRCEFIWENAQIKGMGRIRNISEKGALIECDVERQPKYGDHFIVKIKGFKGKQFTFIAHALVRHSYLHERKIYIGMQFTKVSSEGRKVLRSM